MAEDLPIIYPNAFDDDNIELKIQSMLEEKGIVIYRQVKLIQIITDKDKEKPEQKGNGDNEMEEDEPEEFHSKDD